MPPSKVWRFFSRVSGSSSYAVCDICKNQLKHSSATSGLRYHLIHEHKVSLDDDPEPDSEQPTKKQKLQSTITSFVTQSTARVHHG
jgi:hypothetical protein